AVPSSPWYSNVTYRFATVADVVSVNTAETSRQMYAPSMSSENPAPAEGRAPRTGDWNERPDEYGCPRL
ncbi:MAG: hypothetical protein KGL35_30130, partial [Bradyrhizobium sp.]|nr:hypothetical protein [Bradyrhizobium sp.]